MTMLQVVEVEKLHSQVYDIHSQPFREVEVEEEGVATLQHQGAEEEMVVHNTHHLHRISKFP
jgi:hypothetical protein